MKNILKNSQNIIKNAKIKYFRISILVCEMRVIWVISYHCGDLISRLLWAKVNPKSFVITLLRMPILSSEGSEAQSRYIFMTMVSLSHRSMWAAKNYLLMLQSALFRTRKKNPPILKGCDTSSLLQVGKKRGMELWNLDRKSVVFQLR